MAMDPIDCITPIPVIYTGDVTIRQSPFAKTLGLSSPAWQWVRDPGATPANTTRIFGRFLSQTERQLAEAEASHEVEETPPVTDANPTPGKRLVTRVDNEKLMVGVARRAFVRWEGHEEISAEGFAAGAMARVPLLSFGSFFWTGSVLPPDPFDARSSG